MNRSIIPVLALSFACEVFGARLLGAQQLDQLAAGMRVRATTLGHRPKTIVVTTGTLLAVDSQSVVVRPSTDRTAWTLPFASMRKLEVSEGRGQAGPRLLLGAAIGLAAGAALGWAIASRVDADDDRPPWSSDERHDRRAKRFQLFFTIGGFGAGAAIGATSARDRWREVPLPAAR